MAIPARGDSSLNPRHNRRRVFRRVSWRNWLRIRPVGWIPGWRL